MDKLADLPELDPASVELLEAVGVDRITSLAKSDQNHLRVEMERANTMLRLRKDSPDALEISRWIGSAKSLAGDRVDAFSTTKPVQSSSDAPIRTSVLNAISVSPKKLMEGGITATEIPIMDVFFSEEEICEQAPVVEVSESLSVKGAAKDFSAAAAKVSVGQEKRAFSLPQEDGQKVEKKEIAPLQGKGRQLVNAPLPETNAGKKEHSRSYIRGVLHPQPFKVYLAAIVAILAIPMLHFVVVALFVTMWKPEWWMYTVAVPAVAIIFGLLYLMVCTKPRCRICGQPIFVPKRCFRHVKAHRFPLLGYIIPTSIQLLLFKWFRCIFCGTAVRLKE